MNTIIVAKLVRIFNKKEIILSQIRHNSNIYYIHKINYNIETNGMKFYKLGKKRGNYDERK